MDFKELFLSLDQPVTKNQIFVVVAIGKNCWPVFFMKNNKKVNKVTGWFSKRNISHRNYERRWFQIFVELWFGKAQNWEDWQFQFSILNGVLPKKYQHFYLETAPKNRDQSNILHSTGIQLWLHKSFGPIYDLIVRC